METSESSNETRSAEEILTTIAQLEYRSHKTVEEVSGQVSEMNLLLTQINRRLWAQNIVAWVQLIGLVLMVLLWVALVVALLLGVPLAVDLFQIP